MKQNQHNESGLRKTERQFYPIHFILKKNKVELY